MPGSGVVFISDNSYACMHRYDIDIINTGPPVATSISLLLANNTRTVCMVFTSTT